MTVRIETKKLLMTSAALPKFLLTDFSLRRGGEAIAGVTLSSAP